MTTTSTLYRVLLTGATGGIGQAMAHALLPQSACLVLVGRKANELTKLATELAHKNPTGACDIVTVVADLQQANDVAALVQTAREKSINVLVNNAGINHFGSAVSTPAHAQQEVLAVNLMAPITLTQAMLPALMQQQAAQVVQVGSIFGYIGYPGNSAYCASKFGLRGYAQALRRELSDTPVQVKYFAPRATSTAINTDKVVALNKALGTQSDSPEYVAAELIKCLADNRFERKLGWPERLFVMLNQLVPGINDKAIAGQLPTIRQYF
ncbi:MAG: SDR family oxidoreductase [Limnobacter sp.]|uniref:SDR family oxidoreductase n=1 Tax=Limnobacter sp. TaxID=2003368 RepID=UPI00391B5970